MSKICFVLFCLKQLPVNSTVVFVCYFVFSFGAMLLPGAEGSLLLSSGSFSSFYAMIVSVSTVGFLKVLIRNWLKYKII